MNNQNKLSVFYNEALKFIKTSNYKGAINFINKNLDIFNSDNDLALIYLNSGYLNNKLGFHNIAIDNFSQSIFYEKKIENLKGRSKELPFHGRSDSRYKNGDYKGSIEDKIKAKKIRSFENIQLGNSRDSYLDYRNILTNKFKEKDLHPEYRFLINIAKSKRGKYDLIEDYKKVINDKKIEDIYKKLEILSESKYRAGDFKSSIKTIRRAEKYLQ
tara:strand:+ start:58 stop:702 length:645 start_codon:yes stop_codon:yes gene_type:complete